MNKVIIRHSLIKIINYLSSFLIISYLSLKSSLDNLSIYFFLISLLNFGVLIINYGYSHTSQNYVPKLIEKKFKDKKYKLKKIYIDKFILLKIST